MRYVQIIGKPDIDRFPEALEIIADSPHVTETRMFDWNTTPLDRPTVLYEVIGDRARVVSELAGAPGVVEVASASITDRRFNLLVVFKPQEISIFRTLLETLTRPGLVIAKPVIYRDRQVHARIVGRGSALQSAISDIEREVSIEIVDVGEFDRQRDTPISMLSDRQREALLAAIDLGYYDHPRGATHEDIGDRLDCQPNTASEHLQKAEAKVLTEVLQLEYEVL